MILKLTLALGTDRKLLVPALRCCFASHPSSGSLVSFNGETSQVKETIEEIIKQIKEGGITNGTN